ncbi:ion transporter [Candidatus Woesearchaeota archaeon]|nr:ion transporter [Candidatus Woesearchaeota archaeon]
MNTMRISRLVFILGIAIVVLSGIFDVPAYINPVKMVILVLLGVLIGLLNISGEEKTGFLIAGGIFIISVAALTNILGAFFVLKNIEMILNNMIVLIAPACITVALGVIFEYASEAETKPKDEKEELMELFKPRRKSAWEETFKIPKRELYWDYAVLFAVVLALVNLIWTAFFDVTNYSWLISYIDYFVLAIFFVDLVVLYRKAEGFADFLKNDWLDIVAVIPLGNMFRITKVFRFVRILRFFSKVSRLARVVDKVGRAVKYFSKRSTFHRPLKRK